MYRLPTHAATVIISLQHSLLLVMLYYADTTTMAKVLHLVALIAATVVKMLT